MEQVKQVDGVSEVTLTGGERRQMRVELDPERMTAHRLSPLAIAAAVQAANDRLPAAAISTGNREILLETGTVLRTLNRITLFALIFSIGILVDDAIVVVENIVRHYRLPENRGRISPISPSARSTKWAIPPS